MATPVKRVEIITLADEIGQVEKMARDLGCGYTLWPNVEGWGDRGGRKDDEASGVFANACLMVVCSADQAHQLLAQAHEVTKRYGGLCVVSDAYVLP